MAEAAALEALVEEVRASPKYARIAPEFVRSVARRELSKQRSAKETLKAVKNKLHQVGGAYLSESMPYAAWLAEMRGQSTGLESTCRKAMRAHASTRERLPILEDFFAQTLVGLPPIHSVLDIACGLNPLARPWMPLHPEAHYTAVDIYQDMIDFLNGFFAAAGLPGQARAADVIESPPEDPVDLALVLKAIPCLEQADRQAGARLLEALQARYLLVSFPVHSLGGRQKGMAANYEARFHELTQGKGWDIQRFEFATELAFLIAR